MPASVTETDAAQSTRRPTNVSLDRGIVEAARVLGINLSQACERGIAREVARVQAERWLEENRAALASSNAYVDAHGLPLAAHRQF